MHCSKCFRRRSALTGRCKSGRKKQARRRRNRLYGWDCCWRPARAISFISRAPDGGVPFSFLALLSEGIVAPTAASNASGRSVVSATNLNIETLHKANLDRILDVKLELMLRFGERILPLRDLVEVATGSVIELNKRVQEPADLLLGGKLIARGEVVLSEGNYALRVTEVCEPRQRLENVQTGHLQ